MWKNICFKIYIMSFIREGTGFFGPLDVEISESQAGRGGSLDTWGNRVISFPPKTGRCLWRHELDTAIFYDDTAYKMQYIIARLLIGNLF